MSERIEYHGGFMSPERADELRAELSTLRAENERLREALEAIVKCEDQSETGFLHDEYGSGPSSDTYCSDELEKAMRSARAALQAGENDGV